MHLARGTSPWFYWTWALTIASIVLVIGHSRIWLVAFLPLLVLALLMLNFFRDPERAAAQGIAAPADGVVHSIDAWPDGRTRVATFMNPLDVHVNRAPCDARIAAVRHVPGSFIPAFKKESERNERVEWTFETEHGDILLVQIAGTVARRIIPYLEAGQKVRKGDRIGMIRLGSRVDVYLPPGIIPVVQVGDRLRAGESQLAKVQS